MDTLHLEAIINTHCQESGALLPILHDIQAALGYIPADAIPAIARALHLSRAEVHGVISFYADFRTEPAELPILQLCRGEACQSRGAAALEAHAKTIADGVVTLEPVYCLGLCACAPAVRIGDTLLGRMDSAKLSKTLTPQPPLPEVEGAQSERGLGVRVFVPRDSAAIAVGADAVATAILTQAAERGITIELIRNGSRGLHWLEPLVEVATPAGRIAYGAVTPADIPSLFDADFLNGGTHPLSQGLTDDIPFLKQQERLTFARVGITDPLSLADYAAHGGWQGLQAARQLSPAAIVTAITASGLRGRGGAAFPTGIKWQTVLNTPSDQKYIVCNADEGDSGTFADRMLMEGDPFCLIEGMIIAGLAVGATQGYVYVRSEYPRAFHTLQAAVRLAAEAGWLGDFRLHIRLGAGAYICGEETALLESLEGKRGQVRVKPPLPAISGLFGKPTVVNNVVTLASVPTILANGAVAYRDYGMGRSRGTLAFQLAGNVKHGGLVEKAFGLTLHDLLYTFGGGTANGRAIRTVQVGGPLGAYVPPADFELPLDYEAFAHREAMLGHGGVVVFDDTVDMAAMAQFAMAFCAEESCGKCTPCRIGSTRGVEVIQRIRAGEQREANVALLHSLCDTLTHGSLCAMGGMTPYPVLSALKHFPADFGLEAQTHG